MADYYTSAHLLESKTKTGTRYQGVLKFQAPNPDYVPDQRTESQQRKSFGNRRNPEYVEDTREPNQRKRTITKTVRKVFNRATVRTKAQATKALVKWHAEMEAQHAAPDAGLTVLDYVNAYISGLERTEAVAPSTVHDYRRTCHYLKYAPAIDAVPLRDLTPRQVQAWEAGLLARGLSGTTALKAHRLLKQVCKHAVEIDDLAKSPVRGFKAPSRSTGKPNALDADGRMKAMIELEKMEPTPITIAAELALYTGMRRGEICALTWGNVDLEGVVWTDADEDAPKLRVVQAFGVAKGGAYLKSPKTSKGRRVIPLMGGILDTLKKRRAQMWGEWSEAMRKADIKPTVAAFNQLYVIGYTNGKPCGVDIISRGWKRIADELNLVGTQGATVTLHDLRHTFATTLITRGVDVSSASDLLGHEQVSTTLNMYTSNDNRAKRRAAMIAASDLDAARTGDVLPFVPRTGTEG